MAKLTDEEKKELEEDGYEILELDDEIYWEQINHIRKCLEESEWKTE